jgi:hypothetical protein
MIYLWEDTIDAHPASVRLWEGYLNFRQSTFAKFTVSAMREVFTSAIQTLREQDTKLLKAKGTNSQSPVSPLLACDAHLWHWTGWGLRR